MADGRLPGRVEADELPGDLLDRLARLRLRRLPVGAAHLVQTRVLTADVAADLVEGVGGHVESVTGLAAFGRRVFDDEIFARVLGGALARRPLRHLDEPSDTVPLVDDEVSGGEVEGVDLVALAAGRQSAHVTGRGRDRPPEDVGLGEHGELEVVEDEAPERGGRGHGDEGLGRIGRVLDEGRGHPGLGEHLDHALARPLSFGEDEDPPLVVDEPAHVGEDRLDVTGVALRRPGGDGEEVRVRGDEFGVGRKPPDLPPGESDESGALAHLLERAEGRGGEVDRRVPARGGTRPRGFEELVRRHHEVGGARGHTFGFGDDDLRALGQERDERFHPVGEDRGERLHALDGDACGDLLEHVGGGGKGGGRARRPAPGRSR